MVFLVFSYQYIYFMSKVRAFFITEDILTDPHNFKVLFEGKDRVC